MSTSASLGLVLVALAAAGCLVPQNLSSPEERKASFVAQPDHAALIMYMESSNNSSANLVDEGSRCLAFLGANEFFGAQLAPGRHEVILLGGSGKASTRAITIDVAAGKTYFLLAKPEPPGPDSSFTLTPVRPGSVESIGLDFKLQNMKSLTVDQSGCAKHNAAVYPGWEDLIAKTKAAVANAPPALKPEDGIVWKGTAERAH
jgi:hypothetical protein